MAATPSPTAPPATPTPLPPYQPAAYDEAYSYDLLGNLTSKAGISYAYGANGNGTGAGPHQARSVGGWANSYDANGNLTSGQGRTLTWNAANQPLSITANGVTEGYDYDADGQRLVRSVGGVTTVSIGGQYEEDLPSGTTRTVYTLNGQVIAQRTTTGATSTVLYLHSDQLGSVSAATNASGALVSRQDFGPWGTIRSGGITATTRNFTGQRRDGTGLLFYNARYYDPALARFISADAIGVDRQNPQTRNRYAYVRNNPVRYTDPTGHTLDEGGGGELSALPPAGTVGGEVGATVAEAEAAGAEAAAVEAATGASSGSASSWVTALYKQVKQEVIEICLQEV